MLIEKGAYVLATKYSDGDVGDHWCVGFFDCVPEWNANRRLVVDSDGSQFRINGFRRVQKISQRAGNWFANNAREIETCSCSIWDLFKMTDEEREGA